MVKEVKRKKDDKKKEIKEDNQKDKEGSEKPKQIKQKEDRQLMWIILLMVTVIFIIVAVPYVKNNIINKFEYANLDFFKTITGGVVFYSTDVPVVDSAGNALGTYLVRFRNDPRDLENISVDIIGQKISFFKEKIVFLTFDPEDPPCEDNIVASVGLADFLSSFGGLDIKAGYIDEEFAEENDAPYVTCDTRPDNTVILIKNTNESIIKKTGKNCYEIQYKDCEIDKSIEKFVLVILEGYMQRYVTYFVKR